MSTATAVKRILAVYALDDAGGGIHGIIDDGNCDGYLERIPLDTDTPERIAVEEACLYSLNALTQRNREKAIRRAHEQLRAASSPPAPSVTTTFVPTSIDEALSRVSPTRIVLPCDTSHTTYSVRFGSPPTSEQITEAIIAAEDRLNAKLPELRALFGI